MKKKNTFPLRLPTSLRTAIEQASAKEGTSINQFVVTAVAEKISALETAQFFAEKAQTSDLEQAMNILTRKGGKSPSEEDLLDLN